MRTECVYQHDPARRELETEIIATGRDERGTWIECRATIFHPQGGGQPSDVGTVTCLKNRATVAVSFAGMHEDTIRHYAEASGWAVGDAVLLQVDAAHRDRNARLHSAGHLLAAVVEKLCPGARAQKGFHFPEGPYVELEGEAAVLERAAALGPEIEREANSVVRAGGPVAASLEGEGHRSRRVALAGFAPVPCGGTHVRRVEEIGAIQVRRLSIKRGRLKVSYAVTENGPH